MRPPAVAGLFYPGRRARAARCRVGIPSTAQAPHCDWRDRRRHSSCRMRAISIPAASPRPRTRPLRDCGRSIRRIVLIGPSHRVYLRGMAVPAASSFATPLGEVAIDRELKASLLARRRRHRSRRSARAGALPGSSAAVPADAVRRFHAAAARARLGRAASTSRAALAHAWGDASNAGARELRPEPLPHLRAGAADRCGDHCVDPAPRADARRRAGVRRSRHQRTAASGRRSASCAVSEIARCNSGDTAGDRSRVVGYGAFAVHEPGHA